MSLGLDALASGWSGNSLDLGSYVAALPADLTQVGGLLIAMGIVSVLLLVPAVRRLIARALPLAADSMVDLVALCLTVHYIGFTALQMALLGGLEGLSEVEISLPIGVLLLNGLLLVAFGALGVGLWTRRSVQATGKRLGLGGLTRRQALGAAGLLAAFLAIEIGVSAAWSALDPQGYEFVSGAAEGLYGGIDTPARALALALATGIGEEILFRGALQPRFGLAPTAAIFALGHLQYGFSPALAQVFVMGLALGIARKRANTTVSIAVHALYNLTLVLASYVT
jgi:membrane protease YdiL (CAAX protease family)